MEVILRAEDAKDWFYKGEGAANLVLGYCGSSPSLIGKVVRVQKVPRGVAQSTKGCKVLSMPEWRLWGHIEELRESTSKEIVGQVFSMRIMSPLLGPKHVDGGMRILVSREFLESVDKNVLSQRPAWRIDAAEVNTLCDSALLITDHSVFSNGILKEDVCISVEIKPKCGFLPSSNFIAKRNAIKKCVTRFRMHQHLKLQQREISRVSEYDPLDLFSGSKDRINRAITALYETPQNNFRIFMNGSLIFGGLGGGMDNIGHSGDHAHATNEAIEDLVKILIQGDSGQHLASFLELVAETIFRSGILDQLLTAQKLDVFDIEGVIHAYYNIISEPCMVCKSEIDAELLHQYSLLHSLPLEESLRIVREYLIAATAKDCSLMISFRPRGDCESASEYSSISLESSKQNFDYKACFIDLDMKPLKKMVHYYELDQRIVKSYTNNEAIGNWCDSLTVATESIQIQSQH